MAQDWTQFKVSDSSDWDKYKVNEKTNNNESKSTPTDKPTSDSVVKAKAGASGANMSASEARSDSDIIPARESRSNGILEDNGAPTQDNIITPDEHESLLSKGWRLLKKTVTEPILPERDFGKNSTYYPFKADTPILGNLGIPSMGSIYDTVQEQSSPLNIAATMLPMLEGMNLFRAGKGELPENTPIFRGSEPANASEQFPNEVPTDVAREFAPVGEEGNLLRKNGNNGNVNPEDRLLELAKKKQNMGLDNPDLVSKELSNNEEVKPTAKYLGEQPTGKGDETISLYNIEGGPLNRSTVTESKLKELGIDIPDKTDKLTPPSNSRNPVFNRPGQTGETGFRQNGEDNPLKPRLLLNGDGTFTNKDTGEIFDMRGHKVDPSEHKPASLIDSTDEMNSKEITHDGGSNNPPPDDPTDPEKRGISFSDIINFPKALKASWDLSAPGRQGLGLIHTKAWWTAWNDMFEGMKGKESFDATQKAIENRPLFKSYGDEPSFAQKVGLKLTNLGKLMDREESFMSVLAEKFPGVKTSERAYTAYLNKLRADSFENLMSKYKVLGENGEYNIPLAKEIANYVNNATGRGSLGSLESSAVALNNAFFSPRFLASRLKLLGESGRSVFTPSTYVFSEPSIRREYLKSLLAIAGVGATIGELAKMSSHYLGNDNVSVEHDSNNSDFMKIKIGNTRIDPYAGMQQPIVLASRLLSGKSTSSVSGKTTDLDNPKYGQSNRMDVIGRFARSKESPALSFAHGMLTGKDAAGNRFDVPEQVVNTFVPMVLSDLKQVATENPNLIPYMHEEGLGLENIDLGRGSLALPGMVGAGINNYPSR